MRRALLQQGISTPKGGKARRVPMTEGLAEDLVDVLATSRAVSTERGVDAPPRVFSTRNGTPITPRDLSRTWARLRAKAQNQHRVRPLKLHATSNIPT